MRLRLQLGAILLLAAASPLLAQSTAAKESVQKTTPAPVVPAPRLPVESGDEIDRVVAIVNGDLVLDSDVDEERRFESIQPFRETPVDARDKTIERLINRALILQQAKLQPEDDIPDADVAKEITELRKNIPACKQAACDTKAGWDKYLADHGFTEDQLLERWRSRMEVLRFIEERFRQGIKITDADIKTYYEQTMLPQYAKQSAAPPKLADVSERIQEVLLEQRVSSLLGDWLKSLRAQGSVVVMHPGEGAP